LKDIGKEKDRLNGGKGVMGVKKRKNRNEMHGIFTGYLPGAAAPGIDVPFPS